METDERTSSGRDPWETPKGSAWAIGFGSIDILSALVVYIAVFQGLPTRYFPIDAAATAVILLLAVAGIGLIAKKSWSAMAARVASAVTLALGLALVTTLALTVSYLAGIYGPVGRGGALILGLAAALAIPYVIALPAAQLVWLGPWRRAK
jgi:hypothetical protein